MENKSKILIIIAVFTFLVGICAGDVATCSVCLTVAFIIAFLSLKKHLEIKAEQVYKEKCDSKMKSIEDLQKEFDLLKLEYEKLNTLKNTNFDEEFLKKNKEFDVLFSQTEELRNIFNEYNVKYDELKKDVDEKQADLVNLENDKKKIKDECEMLKSEKAVLLNKKNDVEHEIDCLNEKIAMLLPKVPKIYEVSLETIDNMDGFAFEFFIKELLDKISYKNVTVTNGSGDFGIDVIAEKDGIKYGFQCKLYSDKVGNSAVQEAYAGKMHYGCNTAIVITNNYFTNAAISQAEETGVVLWDRDMLVNMMKEAKINSRFSN